MGAADDLDYGGFHRFFGTGIQANTHNVWYSGISKKQFVKKLKDATWQYNLSPFGDVVAYGCKTSTLVKCASTYVDG